MQETLMAVGYVSNYEGTYRSLHVPALIVGGSFVLVALVLSIYLIFQHLRLYTNPAEQKWIVGIIFMVPVYATESIISLLDSRLSLSCDILRNVYEAFALYCFGRYLVACLVSVTEVYLLDSCDEPTILGGEGRVVELLDKESRKHLNEPLLELDEKQTLQRGSFISFFRRPEELGSSAYTVVKFGLVQYMILKTLCAFLAFLLELFGVYGNGEFKWYYGYPYIAAVLNFSQMWALYCLVQFYHLTHQKLHAIKPLAKFISFKAIVFATWWQGVGIALLCALGVLPKEGKFQNGLQDFLICVEMAIAAVAHIFVFSAKPYQFLSVSEHGKIVSQETKTTLKLEEGKVGKEQPVKVEQTETLVEAPGTSIKESVQDIVLGGGEHVVKDVVLTINQAIEPVEKGLTKGVTKIQEKFHRVSVDSVIEGRGKEYLEVEELVEDDIPVNVGNS
ncbi:hypothetical protein GIB67_025975 [Kingdonia uniflora]|uniref:Protein LAZ1 homolog 2 n=1 Tax=Kingdonia uniflora TaxID=39325 RepID=A0A7J7L897_9MAGN|nr:hypothetical protein GIB67_025975 [Kingdonia uniflora]